MKTLLSTKESTVVSILGFKLWIAKCDQSNWCLDLNRNIIGFFNTGIQYGQKTINEGLKHNLIK